MVTVKIYRSLLIANIVTTIIDCRTVFAIRSILSGLSSRENQELFYLGYLEYIFPYQTKNYSEGHAADMGGLGWLVIPKVPSLASVLSQVLSRGSEFRAWFAFGASFFVMIIQLNEVNYCLQFMQKIYLNVVATTKRCPSRLELGMFQKLKSIYWITTWKQLVDNI